MPVGHDITLDGSLADWLGSDRIDDFSQAGYEVYGTVDDGDFVFALKAPGAIGTNTTAWINTDSNAATGYQIWGALGGAEYNVNFAADGTVNLYTGGAGETLVLSGLSAVWSADRTVVEFRLPASAIGSPASVQTLYDFNDTTFLPGDYWSGRQFTVYNESTVTPASDTRIGIIYSETTAKAYFSETAYSQLFMAAQSQAMQAGIPFDILTESDLTDLNKLSQYDALVFPSFRNVPQDKVAAIAQTLDQASKLLGIGLITAGEFMTNKADNTALDGDPYAQMKLLFDATRVTGGTGDVVVTASDASGQILDGYANGQVVNSYSGVGWNAFTSVSGTGQVIATETINGGSSYAAALATQTGGRNVLFSTEGVMADANLLQKAIDYSVNGTGISVGLQLTRDAGIVAARVDMDQSQESEDVNPSNGAPGIYDKLIPILSQWKTDYNFVGSYYVNVGNNPADGQVTDWSVSLPYYKALLDMGNEIGTHSYTHPENTNVLSPAQIQFEFQNSTTILQQQISAYMGTPFVISGAAIPGAPETLPTSLGILPYVANYLTGGYAAQGAGYPNAFGFMTPGTQDKLYFAPNTSFDFTLIEFQNKTLAEANAAWAAEFNKLAANAETPVVVWPWHDYGAADSVSGEPGADSPYSTQLFTDWIARASAAGMEFVTLEDLAERMFSLKAATITSTVSGNTITASVTASNVGDMALDVDGQGSLVIQSVAGWYAYDNDSVFLPQSGGTFTINLGQAQDDVTHITDLPMRAHLIALTGDGRNLSFSLQGEGKVVIDLAGPGSGSVVVSGATVVSKVGEILTLDVGTNGLHAVTLTYSQQPPVITSNGGGASAGLSLAENGLAVTAVVATNPDTSLALTYSISGGADAALFAINGTTGQLSFLAGPNFELPTDAGGNNVYDVIVRATAGSLFDDQALAVTVTNVNEAPVITSNGGGATATVQAAENGTVVTTVAAVDPDAGTTTLAYSIAGGADAAKFAINATSGALTFKAAPNFEAPTDVGGNNVYDVVVRASDGTLVDDQALAVTVTNVNETPVITSNGGGATAALSLAENKAAVATVVASDPDAGTAMIYSIVGGADASKFTINNATGALAFVTAPDFETKADVGANNVYDVIVRASDGALFDDQAIAVTITNVAEAPVITSGGGGNSAAISIVEGNRNVMSVTAIDPEKATVSYAIAGGADASRFTINSATGALAFVAAPNYEVPTDVGNNNIYDVIVRASDGSLTDTQSIAVTVTNNNELPVISSNGGGATANILVKENILAVATVVATDPDGPTDKISYSLGSSSDAALFNINATTGVLTFKAAPDFENAMDADKNNVYQVKVVASDLAGAQDVQDLSITVSNVAGVNLTAATNGSTLNGAGEEDTLTGRGGNDILNGLGGRDILIGAGGNDTINGGAGNDQITGGVGVDQLTGGAGSDRFIYTAASDSTSAARDVIVDFERGLDIIDLAAIDANGTLLALGNQAFLFKGTGAFDGAGQLRYEVVGGDTYISGNTDANLSTTEFSIKLIGSHPLTASDFIL